MKTYLTTFLAVIGTFAFSLSHAAGCGYGLFDADIEQFVSGDAEQARLALIKLDKRGLTVQCAIIRYQLRIENSHISYTRYLENLRSAPSLLPENTRLHFEKMDDETRQREIDRAEKFLQWNVERAAKLRFLNDRISSSGFAGESLQFGKAILG